MVCLPVHHTLRFQPAFIVADPRSVRVSKLNQLEVVTGSGTPPAPRPTPTPFPTPTPLPTSTSTSTPDDNNAAQALCQQYSTGDTGYSVGRFKDVVQL